MNDRIDPLTSAPPSEIPLPKTPLIRVIAQVRFPPILSIEQRDFIAPFQESIRSDYPKLSPEQTQGIILGPQGVSTQQSQMTWRFSDVNGKWRVSLAQNFIALETTAYTSRKDFIGRLKVIVQALCRHFNPSVVSRLGVRYIDRVTDEGLPRIQGFINKELLGMMATPVAEKRIHMLSEALLKAKEGNLLARWAYLPVGTTFDLSAIEAIEKMSWLLDLDMYREEDRELKAERIIEEAESFSNRIYTFFRWVVTDEFLKFYGGKL